MIDGAREDGRLGYLRAARRPHRQTRWFRFLGALYAHIGLSRPLATYLAQRLQTLLINRTILLDLSVFLEFRLATLLRDRLTAVLGAIVQPHPTWVTRHRDAPRMTYPRFPS